MATINQEKVFEKQQDDVFDTVVVQEVEENMPPQQVGPNHELNGAPSGEKKKLPDEVMDIF